MCPLKSAPVRQSITKVMGAEIRRVAEQGESVAVRLPRERSAMGQDLEFLVLGPIDVVAEAKSVVPTSARQRDLLALLLLDANTAVSSDRLIDRLWHGEPPATARSALQTYIARLRTIIDGYPTAEIVTVSDGYRLDIDEQTIDAPRFEELARRGRESLLAGSPRTATETLGAALDLWRGDVLADVRHLEGVHAEVTRLEELRSHVLGTLIDAELALGNHLEMIPKLEKLVEEDPFSERTWARLMLALYRGGRQSDALRAYRRVADILGEELGIEPGPELYNLEERILLQDPSLTRETDGASPRTNLERPVTSFVGRRREIERLIELVGSRPLVTLTGPGGAGKTRLAREIGERVLASYAEGVWFVDLSSIRDDQQVPFTIAETLGVTEQPDLPAVDLVARYLEHRSLLLILDNCEHLLEPTASLARSLLARCPRLTVLATSRQRLGIEGETTWTVPPLSFPGHGASTPVPGEHEAVDLFVERARLVDTDFELSKANGPHVVAICRRLDGLPLAIELAAARVDVLSLADIEHRLGENFSLLERRSRFQPMRHSTLDTAVRWSYDLLDDQECRLFERLSVFAGGFLISDAEVVCSDDRLDQSDVFDVLTKLVDKSLVVAHTSEGPRTRYSMLEPLRAFAADMLANGPHRDVIAERHAHRFLTVAQDAEPELRGVNQREWLERLDADHDNLRHAFDHLLTQDRVEEALRLGASLRWFWKMHDNVAEGAARLESALARDGDVSPVVRSRALTAAAVLKSATDVDAAYDLLVESAEIAVGADDVLCRGLALGWMGLLDRMKGRLDASQRHLEDALLLVGETGEGWAVSFVLGHLGVLAREQGGLEQAIEHHERAHEIAVSIGNPQDAAWNVAGLGVVHLYRGSFEAAIESLELSFEVEDDLGFDFETATILILLAIAKARIGRPDDASALLGRAESVARRLGSARLLDAVYRARATVASSRGDAVRAAQLLGAASRFRVDKGLPRSMFQSFFEQDEQRIRSALRDVEFDDAWESGVVTEMSETTAL